MEENGRIFGLLLLLKYNSIQKAPPTHLMPNLMPNLTYHTATPPATQKKRPPHTGRPSPSREAGDSTSGSLLHRPLLEQTLV
jgi:hypothetical protein